MNGFNCVSYLPQKSKAGSLIRSLDLGLPNSLLNNFSATWSRHVDDEQLALVMPNCLQFVSPNAAKIGAGIPDVKQIYSVVAWPPSSHGKSKILIGARENTIDVISTATGTVLASFDQVFEQGEFHLVLKSTTTVTALPT